MPIYEYQCDACGGRTEVLQKVTDPAPAACPDCAAPSLRKLVSPIGFRLGGSGWYETDFKSGNKRNLVESGSGANDSENKGGENKGGENKDGSTKGKEASKPAAQPATTSMTAAA